MQYSPEEHHDRNTRGKSTKLTRAFMVAVPCRIGARKLRVVIVAEVIVNRRSHFVALMCHIVEEAQHMIDATCTSKSALPVFVRCIFVSVPGPGSGLKL